MTVFLIGKNGQIGSEIDRCCRDKRHTLFSFNKEELDITEFTKVREKIRETNPEVIINASGYHVVSDCEQNPEKAFEINTYALRNLAEICKEKNIRLINYSTDKVFDGKKKVPYTEDDRTNPIQVYGMSKLAGELATHNFYENCITIRTCGVYGGHTGSRIKKGNFVLYILNEAKTKKMLEVSKEQIASFVNATDLAHATLELLEKNAVSGVYHVVNSGCGSWAEFAQEIVTLAHLSLKIIPVDRSGAYSIKIPIYQALSNKKALSLGISLSTWQDGLERYIEFLHHPS